MSWKLQFRHGLVQGVLNRHQLVGAVHAQLAQGLVGRAETLQQVAGGVVEQAFQALEVGHRHQQ